MNPRPGAGGVRGRAESGTEPLLDALRGSTSGRPRRRSGKGGSVLHAARDADGARRYRAPGAESGKGVSRKAVMRVRRKQFTYITKVTRMRSAKTGGGHGRAGSLSLAGQHPGDAKHHRAWGYSFPGSGALELFSVRVQTASESGFGRFSRGSFHFRRGRAIGR
jgi:hypothetical protein